MPKESKTEKKERLRAIKRGSSEYSSLNRSDKAAFNAYNRFRENNKFVSKQKQTMIDTFNSYTAEMTGLNKISLDEDLEIQKQKYPDTFNVIDQPALSKENEEFNHLNDFFTYVSQLESLGNELIFMGEKGIKARELLLESALNNQGGKIWISSSVDNGEIRVVGVGKYLTDETDENGDKVNGFYELGEDFKGFRTKKVVN